MSATFSLDSLAGGQLQVWPGQTYQVQTRAFALGRENLDTAGAFFAAHLPVGRALLIQDQHTARVAGEAVVPGLRAAGFDLTVVTLAEDATGHLHATGERVAEVEALGRGVAGCRALFAVGAGTLNDLAKLASFRLGLPYGVVATAASMNGFTSAIAAIMEDGIKRSVNCAPPVAVFADLDVVAAAPAALTLSGLGDLLSKPVSSGDWRLAHVLLGEPFTEVPLALVDTAFRKVQAAAAGIGRGDAASVGVLLEALLLSGISMACAGTSSPASGGEHLLSHYWDMVAEYRGREIGLHGAQVGVSTLITATLYRHLRDYRPTPERVAARLATLPDVDTYLRALDVCPAPLRPGITAEVKKKHPTPDTFRARMADLDRVWDHLWAELDASLQTAQTLRAVLEAAGAPTTAREIGISHGELREAYRRARDIRARYTVLDLAWELGALDDLEETILQEAGVLA